MSGKEGDQINWITIKKIEPSPSVSGNGIQMDWGHYWIEMLDENGNIESYGWYPSSDTSSWGNIVGAPGVLNGGGKTDPHQGDNAATEFHPILSNSLTDQQVRESIRSFANSFGGNWALGTRDCHTFLKQLMKSVGLVEPADANPFPEWFVSTAYAPSGEVGAPLLPQPTSDTPSNDGSGGSDIGESLIGDNPENTPAEAEFPRPYNPDLPCI
ncbi:MAG: hypothetical protein M0Q43_07225 [Methanothrix sp.]|jgi:hypothetical protein|nr:hypothetical protein [Methanothrix sp.]